MPILTKEEYITDCWNKARSYYEGVLDGSIIACEDIKLAIQRHIKDLERPDIEFKVEAVEKVFKFFSYLYVSKGQQFTLAPFQAFIILALFGPYYKDTDIRKYLYAFLFMARKNGKTTFVSALQLYFLIADGVFNPKSVLISASQNNAKETSFDSLGAIIKSSPALESRLEIIANNTVRFKEVNGERKLGWSKTTVMDMDKLEGYNPTSCILDEIHTYKDSRKFDVLKNALGAKNNPMLFLISTGGYGLDSFCTQLVETGRNVLKGQIQDDRFFYMLYELDEGDDWREEKNWIKANPGLGTVLNYETLKSVYNTSKTIPASLRDFKTKRLNMFLEEITTIIPEHLLIPAFQDFTDDDVKDFPCYLSCDLSKVNDLTSVGALWDGGDKIYYKPYFFFADNDTNALRKGGKDIHQWVQQGYVIESTKDAAIDYDLIKQYFSELNRKFKVKGLYYDPWHFTLIYNTPKDSKGIRLAFDKDKKETIWCVPVSAARGENWDCPIRYMQSLFFEKRIILYPNECLEWNFRNILIEENKWGNLTPNKKKSKDSIDGVISLLLGLNGYLGINQSKAAAFLKSIQKP